MNFFSLFLALLFLGPAVLFARQSELVSLEHRFLPYSEVENLSAVKIQPEFTRLRLGFPPVIIKSRGGFLGSALSYENLHFNYRNWAGAGDPARVDTLHSVQATFFYGEKLKRPHWSMRLFLATGMDSDFSSVTSEAFRAQGGVIFERDKNNAQIGLGVVVVDNYGRTLPFPAVSYEALLAGRHKISARLPTQFSWMYAPNETWEAGLAMRVNGGSYRLEEPGAFHGKTARYSLGTFGPSFRVRVSPRLVLSLDGGMVYRHQFRIYSNRHEIRDYDLEEDYFISVGLQLLGEDRVKGSR